MTAPSALFDLNIAGVLLVPPGPHVAKHGQ